MTKPQEDVRARLLNQAYWDAKLVRQNLEVAAYTFERYTKERKELIEEGRRMAKTVKRLEALASKHGVSLNGPAEGQG